MNPLLGYRKDIDGLRALAVLPVVLFHLGVAPFSGGFVGVDVFFVISGFLIASIVYKEAQAGEFSYARFYERRIRRLFPALAAMLLVTGVVAWFVLLPVDYKLFTEAQGLSVLFLANIHFWNKTDYFNDSVESIPLLHTWSLSVEEQFYLLFPPLLLFLVRRVPLRVSLVLAGIALLSLIGAQYQVSRVPESAFYLTHLRAWELLAGALLAVTAVPSYSARWTRECAAGLGFMLIIGSILWLDKQTQFPGVSALPAVLGSVLIIHAGSSGSTVVSKLLGLRPLVFVGLISYSLYLWHWPLFVFAGYYKILPFTGFEQLGLFVTACLLGWLSWRYVEAPFRGRNLVSDRRKLFRLTGVVAAVLVLVSLPGIISRGASFRLADQVVEAAAVEDEKIPFRRPCFGNSVESVDKEENICTVGQPGEAQFLLWGDSHALSVAHGFDLAARDLELSGRFLARSVCPPLLQAREYRASEVSCSEFNGAVRRYLERHPEIRHVVLVAVWSHYLRRDIESGQVNDDVGFAAGLERTLLYLRDSGRTVTLLEQVPLVDYNVPQVMARIAMYNRDMDIRPARDTHDALVHDTSVVFDSLQERYPLHRTNLADPLCPDDLCLVSLNERPLYRDSNHLSSLGSEFVSPILKSILIESFGLQKK